MTIDTERFSRVPLFVGLEPNDIAKLLQIAEDLSTEPGDVIVREGEPGDGFYVIGDGVFEVVRGGASENIMARFALKMPIYQYAFGEQFAHGVELHAGVGATF